MHFHHLLMQISSFGVAGLCVLVAKIDQSVYRFSRKIEDGCEARIDPNCRIVTLSAAKGLGVRFFAALRMTVLQGLIIKCTNVLHSGLDKLLERYIGRAS